MGRAKFSEARELVARKVGVTITILLDRICSRVGSGCGLGAWFLLSAWGKLTLL